MCVLAETGIPMAGAVLCVPVHAFFSGLFQLTVFEWRTLGKPVLAWRGDVWAGRLLGNTKRAPPALHRRR